MKNKIKFMSKITSKLLLLSIIVSLMSIASISAFADVQIKVNGQDVKAGDYITYTAEMAGIKENTEAINALLKFDDTKLALVSGGKKNPAIIFGNALSNVIYNETQEDGITFNATSIIEGFDFSSEKEIITVTFLVLDSKEAVDTKIELDIVELYNLEDKPLRKDIDYRLNDKLEINVYDGDKTLVDREGESINVSADLTYSIDGLENVSNNNSKNSKLNLSPTLIIIIVIIVLLVCAIIAIVFIQKKQKK